MKNKKIVLKNWKLLDSEYQNQIKKYGSALPSREFILQYLTEKNVPEKIADLIKKLELREKEITPMRQRLRAMVRDGQLQKVAGGKIQIPTELIVFGKVFIHPDGYGFFTPDNGERDGFIAPPYIEGLMHGDYISAKVNFINYDGRKEYVPITIINRAIKTIIGEYKKIKGKTYVISENKRVNLIVEINGNSSKKIKSGDIVSVRILTYPTKYKNATGEIIRNIGTANTKNIKNEIAINNYDIPHVFPNEILQDLEKLPDELRPADYKNRRDMRHFPFVTIDGADARDFDDAVCAQIVGKNCRLHVAIADVAHYVQPASLLDEEAFHRATSIYFPNQVIPMLPEKLSNGLCSLNPYVDRLVLVCTLTINPLGAIVRSSFSRAVIHSQHRFTYEDAEEIIFHNKNTLSDKKINESLQALKEIYQRLLRVRDERGTIEFDMPESQFFYDESGKISQIVSKKRLESHKLIEECMIAANIAAAKFIEKNKLSALFRVHSAPEGAQIKELETLGGELGMKIPSEITPKFVSELQKKATVRPDCTGWDYKILRLMSPANYLTENKGHFGLALSHYCHFTSPIRRYPDLTVHRAIISQLEKHPIKNQDLSIVANHCSENEKRADDVSREVMKSLKCEYLNKHIGTKYKGKIVRLSNIGIFVELDDILMTGLIPMRELYNDFYNYDEKLNIIKGERTKTIFRIGQELDIKILAVNIAEQKIDLSPLNLKLENKNFKIDNKNKKKSTPKKKLKRKSK